MLHGSVKPKSSRSVAFENFPYLIRTWGKKLDTLIIQYQELVNQNYRKIQLNYPFYKVHTKGSSYTINQDMRFDVKLKELKTLDARTRGIYLDSITNILEQTDLHQTFKSHVNKKH